MTRTLDLMEGIASACALDDVWALYCRTLDGFGFDRVIYGLTRVVAANGSLGDLDDAVILSNHPAEYNAAFLNGEMFRETPGLKWAQTHTGAISWGDLWKDAPALSDRERQIVAFHRSMNVTAGYSLSIAHSNARTFAMASLTGRAGLSQADLDVIWSAREREITTLTNMMHLKILSLPHHGQAADLSRRQREALEWVGDGKSYQDIATIMGVSMATVEKHLRLAREKLKVSTTTQAVLKAAFQNQIYTLGGAEISRQNGAPPPPNEVA